VLPTRPSFLIVLMLGACGPSTAAEPASPRPAGGDPPAPPAAAPAEAITDAQFQTLAREVGTATGRHVAAWGTVRLDGSERAYRVATLRYSDMNANEATAAYVIEVQPGQFWSVAFMLDGHTRMSFDGDGDPGNEPPWQPSTDTTLTLAVGHRGGGEDIELAVRDGRLVVLKHYVMDDAREDDTPRVDDEFAKNGVCTPTPCPPLAGFVTQEAGMVVKGPADTAAGL
jgi:hypothetical protein